MDEAEDVELVRRSLNGDTGAFGKLVDRHQRVLFNVALRTVRNREDAQDVTQTAFIKAYRKLDTFDPSRKFFSWIYRILLHEALNMRERRPRHETLEEGMPSPDGSPERDVEAQEMSAGIHGAIEELPPDYRQVILLRHFAHLSYQEMGEVIDLPEKTVKSRLFTARRMLGTILERRGMTP